MAETTCQQLKERQREDESKHALLTQQIGTLKDQLADEKQSLTQAVTEHKASVAGLQEQLGEAQSKASQLPIVEQQLEQCQYEVKSLRAKEQRLEMSLT